YTTRHAVISPNAIRRIGFADLRFFPGEACIDCEVELIREGPVVVECLLAATFTQIRYVCKPLVILGFDGSAMGCRPTEEAARWRWIDAEVEVAIQQSSIEIYVRVIIAANVQIDRATCFSVLDDRQAGLRQSVAGHGNLMSRIAFGVADACLQGRLMDSYGLRYQQRGGIRIREATRGASPAARGQNAGIVGKRPCYLGRRSRRKSEQGNAESGEEDYRESAVGCCQGLAAPSPARADKVN
ncbi:hypothetical protein B0J12DRAFT_753520, partial [Macrophomina phaseolina]